MLSKTYGDVVTDQVSECSSVTHVTELSQIFEIELEGSRVLVVDLVHAVHELDEDWALFLLVVVSDTVSDSELVTEVDPILFNEDGKTVHGSEIWIDH